MHHYRRFPKKAAKFLILLRAYSTIRPPSSSSVSVVAAALNIAIITGTTRTEGPPKPVLGPRVAAFVQKSLERRGHTVNLIDPRDVTVPLMTKPHFSYSKRSVPPLLEEMHTILSDADAYVAITPEYNHAPSPGLLNILNHFGSSTFGFKPSAIVSYSAGQWGGTRAAHALRPVLSELGCLPVSAMIHIPKAQESFDEHGEVLGDDDDEEEEAHARWDAYATRCISQLEWWGEAAKARKLVSDPYQASPVFRTDPSQRNAPT
mmetsp:Transcript_27973/g.43475  ORF Transcript_27973/g.43475 Transcript_27973/m.43475 type:complete len:262 (+) Transcript_27973:235-1020(+)|eukprot:CAMPEP_0196809176 /NCGR_PEP_ID=MMETSP1362-20130617/9138_1 /TAXON_ID=163516 /ORGANISM="Leptocylindrus danicus, Strain CCMP1856" /LENGTH=261 /DNA_ID=CAMNT_0042183777 /DNA_START=103 /DNA_END=888 /DNA_ORIENTATION=-